MPVDFTELPRHFLIARSTFDRPKFNWDNWDPKRVKSPADLPPYLILGERNDKLFKHTDQGWECSWEGSTPDTIFNVKYDLSADYFSIRQTWLGVDGIAGGSSNKIRLDKFILQHMHTGFPLSWDENAQRIIEEKYQIQYILQPPNSFNFAGLPDGFFRTVGFVVSAQNLPMAEKWVEGIVNGGKIDLPLVAKVQRVIQVINYIEPLAPDWTRNDWQLYTNSFEETGFPPLGLPTREVASDGTAAWTVRRVAFAIFISVPFAGLMDVLSLATASNGPIRPRGSEMLSLGMKPVLVPAGFEITSSEFQIWDADSTTRCVWILSNDNELDEVIQREAEMYLESDSHKKIMDISNASSAAFEEFLKLSEIS